MKCGDLVRWYWFPIYNPTKRMIELNSIYGQNNRASYGIIVDVLKNRFPISTETVYIIYSAGKLERMTGNFIEIIDL